MFPVGTSWEREAATYEKDKGTISPHSDGLTLAGNGTKTEGFICIMNVYQVREREREREREQSLFGSKFWRRPFPLLFSS